MKAIVASSDFNSTRDSTGIAHVIYFAGCPRNCEGCHNPALRHRSGGIDVDIENLKVEISSNKLATHVVFSGGEPFEQPEALKELAEYAQKRGKKVWVYTGYTFEQLVEGLECWEEQLRPINVIIAGPFIKGQLRKDYSFLASSNQQAWTRKGSTWYKTSEEALLAGG